MQTNKIGCFVQQKSYSIFGSHIFLEVVLQAVLEDPKYKNFLATQPWLGDRVV